MNEELSTDYLASQVTADIERPKEWLQDLNLSDLPTVSENKETEELGVYKITIIKRKEFGPYSVSLERRINFFSKTNKYSKEDSSVVIQKNGKNIFEYRFKIQPPDRGVGLVLFDKILRNIDSPRSADNERGMGAKIFEKILLYLQRLSDLEKIRFHHKVAREPCNRPGENLSEEELLRRWDVIFTPVLVNAGYKKYSKSHKWGLPKEVNHDQPGEWEKSFIPHDT